MPDAPRPAPAPGKKSAIAALVLLVGSSTATLMIGDIRADEGRRLHAYRDVGTIVTICDGDTKDVHMGQVATDGECDERTARQLLVHARIVIGCAPALRDVGREQQLRAFTRYDYNTGAFCRGWFRARPSPAALVNAGKWIEGCDELLHYDLVKGRRWRGLTLRRQRERAVCLVGLQRPAIAAVRADFPACVTIKPPPLLRSPRGRMDYRPGAPFNDKGIS